MITKFIEVTNGPRNWGKFMVGRFDPDEWARRVAIAEVPSTVPDAVVRLSLLHRVGWTRNHLLVLDLQTGEGAMFIPGGYAKADLDKHQVWVCPMFEPFLTWLYQQDLSDLGTLPAHVDLPDAPFAMQGYRRSPKRKGRTI